MAIFCFKNCLAKSAWQRVNFTAMVFNFIITYNFNFTAKILRVFEERWVRIDRKNEANRRKKETRNVARKWRWVENVHARIRTWNIEILRL